MTPPRVTLLTVVGGALGCFLLSLATRADPLFAFEAAGALVVCLWGVIALALVRRSTVFARAVSVTSSAGHVAGVACRVIQDPGRRAFAAGSVRPSVYVTTGAIDDLTEGELRAVLLHEVHHARTRAPLRATFVEAWLVLVRPVPPLHRRLVARLAAIETAADSYALEAGATRPQLASALLKFDPSSPGANFSGHADARVTALLNGQRLESSTAPLEWIPAASRSGARRWLPARRDRDAGLGQRPAKRQAKVRRSPFIGPRAYGGSGGQPCPGSCDGSGWCVGIGMDVGSGWCVGICVGIAVGLGVGFIVGRGVCVGVADGAGRGDAVGAGDPLGAGTGVTRDAGDALGRKGGTTTGTSSTDGAGIVGAGWRAVHAPTAASPPTDPVVTTSTRTAMAAESRIATGRPPTRPHATRRAAPPPWPARSVGALPRTGQ